MADFAQRVLSALRALNFEQRVAAAAALLLVVSTFGPFSFVEAAEVLLAFGVLALLFARGEGRAFHLPFGDGTIIAGAGVWAAALIVVRLFDRSLGQNLLALACAALLFLAGARERAKHPPDDLPGRGGLPAEGAPPTAPARAGRGRGRAVAAARVRALPRRGRRAAAAGAGGWRGGRLGRPGRDGRDPAAAPARRGGAAERGRPARAGPAAPTALTARAPLRRARRGQRGPIGWGKG